MFNINHDNELIVDGTHFWCKGHMCAVPVSQRAAFDSEYCHDCAKLLRDSRNEKKKAEPVRWSPGGQVCIIDGRGYKVGKHGGTICVGPVDETGKSRSGDVTTTTTQTQQAAINDVSKIKHDTLPTPKHSRIQKTPNYETKKRRGRPEKTGKISRITAWRRRQAAMI